MRLERRLPNSFVIDQDNHASFLNRHYAKLLPERGPNKPKYALTEAILNYALTETDRHLILCNANRDRAGRKRLLSRLKEAGLFRVLVYFDLPTEVLRARVAASRRSTDSLRTASSFEEVLERQLMQEAKSLVTLPDPTKVDAYLAVKRVDELEAQIDDVLVCLR